MEDIAKDNPELNVRYIDLTRVREKKQLPVIDQYKIKGTPEFILFDPEGKQTMRGMQVWTTIQNRWKENKQ